MTIGYRDFDAVRQVGPSLTLDEVVESANQWIAGIPGIRVLNVESIGVHGDRGVRVWYKDKPVKSTSIGYTSC
jgi:hypothetical protein